MQVRLDNDRKTYHAVSDSECKELCNFGIPPSACRRKAEVTILNDNTHIMDKHLCKEHGKKLLEGYHLDKTYAIAARFLRVMGPYELRSVVCHFERADSTMDGFPHDWNAIQSYSMYSYF